MDVLKNNPHKSDQKMKLKERDKPILEYVQCMYNNVHAHIRSQASERETERER